MINKSTLEKVNKEVISGSIILKAKLRLNIDNWGKYKKGDEDYFYFNLLSEQNGLIRYSIDKKWDIISTELVNKNEQ
jgi:hypothetical protein